MRTFLVVVVLLGVLALPLMAQDNPKAEVFGGYQYLHIGSNSSGDINSGQGFNGWDAAVTGNLSKYFGVTGDFSGSYATISGVSFKVYTYGGGPVVFTYAGRVKPFAHVLFGGAHLSGSESSVSVSTNGYTVMAGGGLDVGVAKNVAIRLGQFDWLYYHFSGFSAGGVSTGSFSSSNNVRFSTGIVFRF
jgi:hypothetical protein